MRHYKYFTDKHDSLLDECKYELVLLIHNEYNDEFKPGKKDEMIRLHTMLGTPLIYALKSQGSEVLYRECMWQSQLNIAVCISQEWKILPREEIINVYKELFKLTYGDISYNKFTS
jgi:hypothetical protein